MNEPAKPEAAPAPGARAALMLLLAINLFNYIDRQVLSAVLPRIKDEFLADDPLAKTKAGALTTAFMVSYMVLSMLFGWIGDRWSRWKLIAIGVILWSLASGASGLAVGFWMLLLTRCFVGVGEAAYGPVAPTVISDLYPVRRRGSVLAWFYMAIPVGSALGFVIGGQVSEHAGWGWRGAFYVVVIPGLILGLIAWMMREPKRGLSDQAEGSVKSWRDYLILLKIRSYVLNTAGMTAMTFVLGGLAAVMPLYIYEREARFQLSSSTLEKLAGDEKVPREIAGKMHDQTANDDLNYQQLMEKLNANLSGDDVNRYAVRIQEITQTPGSMKLSTIDLYFGVIIVVSGLVATLLGGMAGDRLRDRVSGAYFLVSGLGMLIGFPLFIAVLWVPFPYAWGFLFFAVFFLFFNTGPTNTALANVTHPAIRATAFAINIFVIHALGDAISPLVLGALADTAGWNVAILTVSLLILLSGAFWLWGCKYLNRDTENAPRSLN